MSSGVSVGSAASVLASAAYRLLGRGGVDVFDLAVAHDLHDQQRNHNDQHGDRSAEQPAGLLLFRLFRFFCRGLLRRGFLRFGSRFRGLVGLRSCLFGLRGLFSGRFRLRRGGLGGRGLGGRDVLPGLCLAALRAELCVRFQLRAAILTVHTCSLISDDLVSWAVLPLFKQPFRL